ncbi:hypothetical protein MMC26_006319 [Xylographa opegraphella]|nr:hypothetical protein [Xylographa opegraphella]
MSLDWGLGRSASENALGQDVVGMPISYDKIVSSPIFTFFIGKQHPPTTIHTALVAEQSPALGNLVTGIMEEGQTGRVTFDDVDEDTFARFAQFVYMGDYAPAAHRLEVESPPPETIREIDNEELVYEAVPPDEESWGKFRSKSKKEKKIGMKMAKAKSAQRRSFRDLD